MMQRGTRLWLSSLAALAIPLISAGQTCTITNPSASQIFQVPQPSQLTLTTTGAPTAYRAVWYIDGLRWAQGFNADQHQFPVAPEEAWTGTPFAVQMYTGLLADGPHWVFAKVFDIFTDPSTGTPLCTTPTVNFTVRIEGLSSISLTQTTSGVGETDVTPPFLEYNGNASIDGLDVNSTESNTMPSFNGTCAGTTISNPPPALRIKSNTYCWPNGPHLVHGGFTGGSDPLVESLPLSSVVGNEISFGTTNHIFENGRPVVFTAVSGLTPIVAGSQWFWSTSGTNPSHTATLSWSGMTGTITTSSASGASGSVPIYVQNVPYTNQSEGTEGCDGYYLGTASGASITFTASPTCPAGTVIAGANTNPVQITLSGPGLPANGDQIVFSGFTGSWASLNGTHIVTLITGSTYSISGISTVSFGVMTGSPVYDPPGVSGCSANTCNLEVDVNPYFVQYVDATDISLSATPGGPTVALSCSGCSGTIQTRLNSPWFTCSGQNGYPGGDLTLFDYTDCGGIDGITQLVTFSNGTKPMAIDLPYGEYRGYAGKTGDTLCPVGATWIASPGILNTDLSHTSEPCSHFTYTVTNTNGITGAISVDASGNITYNATSAWTCSATLVAGCPPQQGAWAAVQVHCDTCGVGGIAIPYATAQIQNCGGSPCTFPHFSYRNGILNTFTPGESFYPITVQQVDSFQQKAWSATALHHANVNSIWIGLFGPGADMAGLVDPSSTSCPSPPAQPVLPGVVSWLNANNFASVFEMYNIWTNFASYPTSLQAILQNIGYNRQACLQNLISYVQSAGSGLYAINADDEITNALGGQLNPNPTIAACGAQGVRWCEISISGGVATFTVSGVPNIAVWNQSAGTGSAFQISGIASNSACNGLYLPSSVSSTTIVAPALAGCTSGTITSATDPGATMNVPFSDWDGPNPAWQNAGVLPWNLSAGGCARTGSTPCQLFSSSVYLTVNGSTATLALPSVTGLSMGQVIRLWGGTTANLNIIAPITSINAGASTVTFTYPGTTGGLPPTCTGTGNQCNGTTDGSAYVTIDPNWGTNPLMQFYSIINSMPNPPPNFWTILGSFFGSGSQTLTDFEGTPSNSRAAWVYVATSPLNIYGYDGSIWNWAGNANGAGIVATRPYQLPVRGALLAAGAAVGNNVTIQLCQSFGYDPACDRPTELSLRPETMVAQIMGFKVNGIRASRIYNELDAPENAYAKNCCGWLNQDNWQGTAISPTVGTKRWKAYAETNALLKVREDTELQPETNKPYLGPYFQTDAHLSATYGNETTVLCGDEMPYGSLTVPLNPISGGSTLLYTSDGYSTRVSAVSGNPSAITREWCPSPGFTSVYVSQPPGYTALDNITFGPPQVNGVVSLPFGASKFLIQVGYYSDDMRSDPVTDCTSGCIIGIDHHNINAWYRVVYANSSSLPVSIGAPVEIPSQGLY